MAVKKNKSKKSARKKPAAKKKSTRAKPKAKGKKKAAAKKTKAGARKVVKKAKAKPRKKAVAKKAGKTSKTKIPSPKVSPKPKDKPKKNSQTPAAPLKSMDPSVEKLRQKLIQDRSQLLRMIASSQEIERNVGDLSFSNEIDLASSLEGREMAFQLSSRERNELKLIEAALFKIANGSYGVCEECSKRIGTKRLQIMPLTPLCIDCQESREVL